MRPSIALLALAMMPSLAAAQASQFGVRGLGAPGRGLAVRSLASAGAFGLFDSESSLNPAALGGVATLTSVFTATESFNRAENPGGSASLREARFPQLSVAGPIRESGAAVGFSYSNYTSRDFTLANGGVLDLRGQSVGFTDTISSRGGLSDLRAAGAYRIRDQWIFGAGFHVITGSTRLVTTRVFHDPDSTFLSARQRSEISYAGVGVSVGLIRQFGPRFGVALVVRSDGHTNVDRDSVRVATVDLPYTFGFGLRWQPSASLGLASGAIYRTWSGANSDLIEQGGAGAENTIEISFGGEYVPDVKRPFRRPLRFGARYATLPFPFVAGQQAHEISVSAGTGMRFAQQRAGIDLALEYARRSQGDFSERGFNVSLGISVRP